MENITNSIESSQSSSEISISSISSNKIIDSSNFSLELNENNEKDNYEFITCPYCEIRIYYKKDAKKRINGINIKCTDCFKYFFVSNCPKCKKFHKIKKFVDVCELIECPEPNCRNQYLQSPCVIAGCNDCINFTKPRNLNLPNGIIYNHKSKLVFQKISCYYCLRPIDFITKDENKINRYYEGQRVKCPYQDCGKEFNRLICSKCCSVVIVELGMYSMGSKIKCQNCNNYFAKILCCECSRLNPIEKHEFKYGQFECMYSSCSKKSNLAICLHCLKINTFNIKQDQHLIPGQSLLCGYPECKNKFSITYCPSCNNLNPFPKGDFIFGKLYKCKYKAICSKSYMVLICPKCRNYSRKIEEVEGKSYSCEKCKTLFRNYGCPYCNASILETDSKNGKGEIIKCPKCEGKFSFCRCFECKKLIYLKDNKSILGKAVTCNCGNNSVNIICPQCNVRISITERDNDIENGEKLSCPNCSLEFVYNDNNTDNNEENIIFKNLSVMESLEGKTINFGKPEVDENYLETLNYFIDPKLIKDSNNSTNISSSNNETNDTTIKSSIIEEENRMKIIKSNLCIVCQCREKESVFFPCGHRHTCYKCAVYYFETFKKCPRCGKKAEAIIPKIYNT